MRDEACICMHRSCASAPAYQTAHAPSGAASAHGHDGTAASSCIRRRPLLEAQRPRTCPETRFCKVVSARHGYTVAVCAAQPHRSQSVAHVAIGSTKADARSQPSKANDCRGCHLCSLEISRPSLTCLPRTEASQSRHCHRQRLAHPHKQDVQFRACGAFASPCFCAHTSTRVQVLLQSPLHDCSCHAKMPICCCKDRADGVAPRRCAACYERAVPAPPAVGRCCRPAMLRACVVRSAMHASAAQEKQRRLNLELCAAAILSRTLLEKSLRDVSVERCSHPSCAPHVSKIPFFVQLRSFNFPHSTQVVKAARFVGIAQKCCRIPSFRCLCGIYRTPVVRPQYHCHLHHRVGVARPLSLAAPMPCSCSHGC